MALSFVFMFDTHVHLVLLVDYDTAQVVQSVFGSAVSVDFLSFVLNLLGGWGCLISGSAL